METTRQKWYNIIFKSDTKPGKDFDVILLILILISVVVVMLDSVEAFHRQYSFFFDILEWILTIIFTLEYLVRLYVHPKRIRYVFSFWGIIDFLSIVPTYLSLFFIGYHYMIIVRIFRLLRVFRIFKLVRFSNESEVLWKSLRSSMYKVSIFFFALTMIVVLMGTIMYVVEGAENGFDNIPKSIYWAIVTITTVGYGDMVPQTVLGKFLSSLSMIIGYSIIAIPTGIVTSEITKRKHKLRKCCSECGVFNDISANFCKSCGEKFDELIIKEE